MDSNRKLCAAGLAGLLVGAVPATAALPA